MNKNVLVLLPFIQGGINGQIVKMVDEKNNESFIEPYLVYKSTYGSYLIYFYQISGFSNTGQNKCWKRMEISRVTKVVLTENYFIPRSDYNPFDKAFRRIYFAIPKFDRTIAG